MLASSVAAAGEVQVADFGITRDGARVRAFTLLNDNGASTASVHGHRLRLEADRIAVKDGQGMLSGELRAVVGTALALDGSAPLGRLAAAAADPAFAAPRQDAQPLAPGQFRSFDHSYVFKPGVNRLNRTSARLEDDASGRVMEMRTTETSVQVFIPAGSRPGLLSDSVKPFQPGHAVALETQHLPDSPNHPEFPSTACGRGRNSTPRRCSYSAFCRIIPSPAGVYGVYFGRAKAT
jgi:aldose 1-epimerase